MERIETLRLRLNEELNLFQDLQRKKRLCLLETRKTILEVLLKNLSEDFRRGIQRYFEWRNEVLHSTLKELDEALNLASEAHTTTATLRSHVLDTLNVAIRPLLVVEDDSCLLVFVSSPEVAAPSPRRINALRFSQLGGRGVSDLQIVSTETEKCVLRINDLQIKYSEFMAYIEEKMPVKIDAILKDMEDKIGEADQESDKLVTALVKASENELKRAALVLESMESIKKEMEGLFKILRKPNESW